MVYRRRKTYHLTKGDLFAVFPSQVVCYVADHLDPWEYYWVGFNGTEARRMVQMTGFTHDRPVLRPSSPEDCKSLLLRIYESSGNTPAADACMAGYLYLFLGHLMKGRGTRPGLWYTGISASGPALYPVQLRQRYPGAGYRAVRRCEPQPALSGPSSLISIYPARVFAALPHQ